MKLTVRVHQEDDSYWAQVSELPGCFATGDTLDGLWEALKESIELYLAEGEKVPRRVPAGAPRLDEFQVYV